MTALWVTFGLIGAALAGAVGLGLRRWGAQAVPPERIEAGGCYPKVKR